MNSYTMVDFFIKHGLLFAFYLILSMSFLDILRQLDTRPLSIKITFACLTAGCFSISIYALSHTLPIILYLIALGLLPLCDHKVRYSIN